MPDIRQMLARIDIEKTFKEGLSFVKDNLPIIFSISAVGCLGLSIYETAKATHKSDKAIADEEARRAAELPLYKNTELTALEKVELCWRNYIPVALYGGACAFFIIAAERKGNEKYLALLSAYELTKKAGEERKDVELGIIGAEKVKQIDSETDKRMANNVIPRNDDIPVVEGNGEKTLYYEPYTGTAFWATYEDILHAFNYVNYIKHHEGAASINHFLEDLGLRKTILAEDFGWNEDEKLVEPILDVAAQIDDDPSKPATVIHYSVEPLPDYGSDRRQF